MSETIDSDDLIDELVEAALNSDDTEKTVKAYNILMEGIAQAEYVDNDTVRMTGEGWEE